MAETLIVFIDDNKSRQNHVAKLISQGSYAKVIVACKEGFPLPDFLDNAYVIKFNPSMTTTELSDYFYQKINIKDFEVHLNIICGEGREHTAMISALVRRGIGIRFAVVTNEGVKEL